MYIVVPYWMVMLKPGNGQGQQSAKYLTGQLYHKPGCFAKKTSKTVLSFGQKMNKPHEKNRISPK